MRLSRDDEPLQSLVHDLPAHLRGTRAARRHELGALHFDRRPDSKPAARGLARRRRTDASEKPAKDGALSQGPRHLRPLQYQWHAPQREERPRVDRGGAPPASPLPPILRTQVLFCPPPAGL